LLPFDQFVFSELAVTDAGQQLRVVFASHEVTLTGCSLRRIEAALQRMELAVITRTKERMPKPPGDNETTIHEIVVETKQVSQ